MDINRGVYLPEKYGFTGDETIDKYGRPRQVNLFTVADYLSTDILAADRYFQPESNRSYPLFPHQRIMFKEIMARQFLWVQMMRGGAKSSSAARMFLNYALMVPGTPILLTAPSFRQALFVYDEIVKLIEMNRRNENAPFNIGNELSGDIKRGNMEAVIRFQNGSVIRAVPMGDGRTIRGLRGGLIFIDEGYQITEEAYSSHIAPMAQVRQGGRASKIIIATTSWYQDCFAYQRLMQIASEVKAGNPLYGILDFTLDDLTEEGVVAKLQGNQYVLEKAKFPLDPAVWKDAQRHGHPIIYAMTYFNIWPDVESRWYEQKAIDTAISNRHAVRVELAKQKGDDAVYFAVVDLAASDKGDSSCILVAKVKDGIAKYVYGRKGKGWSGHRRAWETHEVIRKFDPKFVLYDAHAAIGVSFRQDMSLDTLVVQFDETHSEIKTVKPAIHWDEHNRRGDRVLIPVSAKDDAVVMALTDHRNGDIGGEDGLSELLHSKTRTFLWEGKMLGPGIDAITENNEVLSKMEYSGSEQEALDVVREAFNQLGKISLDKDAQGNKRVTKSGKLAFKKKSGTSVDDGAFCLVYGSIGLLRLGGSTTDQSPHRLRVKPMAMGDSQSKTEGQIYVQRLRYA